MQFLTNPKTLAVIGGIIGSISVMIGGLHNWHDALTPSFVGGALGTLATALTALRTDSPTKN